MRYSERPTYVQQGLLGKGSFAEVYRVRLQNKLYALKRIYNYHLKDENYYKSIKREIAIMQKLDHPNIIKLIEVYETDNSLQLLLQYMPNGSLYDKIKTQNRIPQCTAKKIISDLVKAVKYLHSFSQPILHRDIKPENILLNEDNTIKICDFGSANLIVPNENRSSYVGTEIYMAPQMKQLKSHDQSLDLWCIGVLMYQLLTGSVPNLDLKDQSIVYPQYISRPAEDLIKKILVKDKSRRISIEDIQNHVWFQRQQHGLYVDKLLTLSKTTKIEQMVQKINQKMMKAGNQTKQTKKPQMLLQSESLINKVAKQSISQQISKLKSKCSYLLKIKKNQQKISNLRQKLLHIRQIKQMNNQMTEEKSKFLKEIATKQKNQQDFNKSDDFQLLSYFEARAKLLNNLEQIKQMAQKYPCWYQQLILSFKDVEVDLFPLPLSEYLPKLKVKMIEHKRDALIQLKCIKKRKKEIEMLLFSNVKQQNAKYGFEDVADMTTQAILIKNNI